MHLINRNDFFCFGLLGPSKVMEINLKVQQSHGWGQVLEQLEETPRYTVANKRMMYMCVLHQLAHMCSFVWKNIPCAAFHLGRLCGKKLPSDSLVVAHQLILCSRQWRGCETKTFLEDSVIERLNLDFLWRKILWDFCRSTSATHLINVENAHRNIVTLHIWNQ